MAPPDFSSGKREDDGFVWLGGEPSPAAAVGKETTVANAMKAVRQAVDEEAANELVRMKRHQPGRGAMKRSRPPAGAA